MNYEELSDREINKLVAEKLGYKNIGCSNNCPDIYIHDISCWREYCNNPNDSWPIILENRIDIYAHAEGSNWEAELHFKDYRFRHIDINPLRAAMIVYLVMESKK